MADLPGPKIRIGFIQNEPVFLNPGQPFTLVTDRIDGDETRASISFRNLPQVVNPGDKISMNDGFIRLQVEDVRKNQVVCRVIVGGELRSNKGVNLPGIELGISAFTENDRRQLEFAAEQKLDAVSQSFVEGPGDITALRQAARDLNYDPFVVAKIERAKALDNLEEILKVCDGIMVARGDLGVEIPIEKIAIVQKQIIRLANYYGRPVITATHMLESMVDHNRPTRAEATDVANAILDGTDCLMLSGETAIGDFPVESVEVMTSIAVETEPFLKSGKILGMLDDKREQGQASIEDMVSESIYKSIEVLRPDVVLTPTMSGATSRRICRFHLPIWILGISPRESTCSNLQFSYGVYPILEPEKPEDWEKYTCDLIDELDLPRNLALLTEGSGTSLSGGTNQIQVIDYK
jgi:pyruvate kinase